MSEAPSRLPPKTLLRDALGVLVFRAPSLALADHPQAFLIFGLVCTWIAGIGRYWDNPEAYVLQSVGLGSVAYVFVLALVLWLIAWPLRPMRWTYLNVLLFVTLTSPPALLYAIPAERFLPMETAQIVNLWFLAVVAAWRVALLAWFLVRLARLRVGAVVVVTLLPLALIVAVLSALNLEHVTADMMSGTPASANDTAYLVVVLLAIIAEFASPVLLLLYVYQVVVVWWGERIKAWLFR